MMKSAGNLFRLLVLLLVMAVGPAAAAAKWVSIPGNAVNMRAAPGTDAQVIWQVGRYYPLQVVGSKGEWLKVRDFEGDGGWILARLTSKTPTMIAKRPGVNIRKGPGKNHPIAGRAEYGQVFITRKKQGGWVRVELPEGKGQGWVDRSLLWGW